MQEYQRTIPTCGNKSGHYCDHSHERRKRSAQADLPWECKTAECSKKNKTNQTNKNAQNNAKIWWWKKGVSKEDEIINRIKCFRTARVPNLKLVWVPTASKRLNFCFDNKYKFIKEIHVQNWSKLYKNMYKKIN